MNEHEEFVAQWYWQRDWLNRKCKAFYFGPRIEWMNLDKERKKSDKRKATSTKPNSRTK